MWSERSKESWSQNWNSGVRVTFSLSLMDPFPRIDIFVRVSSCSLFNEFPRGPRSLPTKLNCNRKWERRSIRISVFEIKTFFYVSHMWLKLVSKASFFSAVWSCHCLAMLSRSSSEMPPPRFPASPSVGHGFRFEDWLWTKAEILWATLKSILCFISLANIKLWNWFYVFDIDGCTATALSPDLWFLLF